MLSPVLARAGARFGAQANREVRSGRCVPGGAFREECFVHHRQTPLLVAPVAGCEVSRSLPAHNLMPAGSCPVRPAFAAPGQGQVRNDRLASDNCAAETAPRCLGPRP